MVGRRFIWFFRRNHPSHSSSAKPWGRRLVSGGLICVTGGVALSALDDLVIYHSCSSGQWCHPNLFMLHTRDRISSKVQELNHNNFYAICIKAMEKASKNQAVVEAIGEPIARGPWYNASLAVTHKRHSVSCTFPVSGPHGTGIFQLRAVRNGEESWLSFFRPRDWEILIMEALLHVPENEERNRTFRIRIMSDDVSPPACIPSSENKRPQDN
ncbi:hypothetical protein SSX86_024595 [Deinandra increscens subsp. villosa]|uniref:Uncharacterized protein n=1 Tax=Deinandra increscens subsp. villosa TaxID=3103831 RepID=A0AAP0GL93_9ASTR